MGYVVSGGYGPAGLHGSGSPARETFSAQRSRARRLQSTRPKRRRLSGVVSGCKARCNHIQLYPFCSSNVNSATGLNCPPNSSLHKLR
jgi:hypothetical protein